MNEYEHDWHFELESHDGSYAQFYCVKCGEEKIVYKGEYNEPN